MQRLVENRRPVCCPCKWSREEPLWYLCGGQQSWRSCVVAVLGALQNPCRVPLRFLGDSDPFWELPLFLIPPPSFEVLPSRISIRPGEWFCFFPKHLTFLPAPFLMCQWTGTAFSLCPVGSGRKSWPTSLSSFSIIALFKLT